MFKRFFHYTTLGLQQMRLHGQYLLVAVLLIVLPLTFIFVGQSYFETAYNNIETVDRQAVGQLHDTIAVLLEERAEPELIQSLLVSLATESTKVEKIRVLDERGDDLVILASSDATEVGMSDGGNTLYARSGGLPGESLIFEYSVNNNRVWHSFREVSLSQDERYIYSEHSFAAVDTVLTARQQQTYLVLPIIFIFLMLLAYWLVKQTQWQREYGQAATKLKDQMLFTNTIAHELRAPLTTIRGYASFLEDAEDISNEHKKYAENISISSKRLVLLINDFLEVARIQSGSLKVKFTEIDVRKPINEVQETFREQAAEKGIDLLAQIPETPILAETDSARLQQVLTNLVSNALKYTEQGEVVIALEQTKLKTIITIKDTGNGISAEDQKKLFGAFTRVGTADASGVTGTGLGMWITKQLVELLHGEVQVESIKGVGTHVKLLFYV